MDIKLTAEDIDEAGRRWGSLLNQTLLQIVTLEAQAKQHQAQIAQAQQHIAALEDEITLLRTVQPATWSASPIAWDGNKKAAPVVDGSG